MLVHRGILDCFPFGGSLPVATVIDGPESGVRELPVRPAGRLEGILPTSDAESWIPCNCSPPALQNHGSASKIAVTRTNMQAVDGTNCHQLR